MYIYKLNYDEKLYLLAEEESIRVEWGNIPCKAQESQNGESANH